MTRCVNLSWCQSRNRPNQTRSPFLREPESPHARVPQMRQAPASSGRVLPLVRMPEGLQRLRQVENTAVGFVCPVCSCDTAHLKELRLPQVVLVCSECSWEWAVEP